MMFPEIKTGSEAPPLMPDMLRHLHLMEPFQYIDVPAQFAQQWTNAMARANKGPIKKFVSRRNVGGRRIWRVK